MPRRWAREYENTLCMGRQAAIHLQSYGAAVIWRCPQSANMQSSNMAIASGLGTFKGASGTLAIEWAYGEAGQSETQSPAGHFKTLQWCCDHLHKFCMSNVVKAWHSCVRCLTAAKRHGGSMWAKATSAMSASIATPDFLGWKTWSPRNGSRLMAPC